MTSGLARDLRHAARSLGRAPGFVAAAVLVLSLGIGGNSAIFSLVNAVLLRPLPGIAGADGLFNVHAPTSDPGDFGGFSHPDYLELRDGATAFADLAAFHGRGMSLGEGDATELVGAQLVSGNYFRVLAAQPQLGRLLMPQDDRAPGADAAVISHRLWQRRFAGDPAIVGRAVRLNGARFTVVGVTPPGFQGNFVAFPFDAFVPLATAERTAPGESLAHRDADWLELVGRRRNGVGLAQAEGALAAAARHIDRAHPRDRPRGILVRAWSGVDDNLRAPVLAFLAVVQGAAALLLLVASTNVASMLLVRAAARRREVGIRLALGAGAWPLARQLMVETLLLFALGAAGGLALAAWSADLLLRFQPRFPIPLHLDLRPDARVLAFTAGVSLVAALLSGLAPAAHALRLEVMHALRGDGGGGSARWRRLLVVAQVAGSLVLLVGALLFARTLLRARGVDPGFETRGVHVLSVNLATLGRSEERGRAFHRGLLELASATPGIRSAAIARRVPLSLGSLSTAIEVDGLAGAAEGVASLDWNVVSPGYFETLGIPILAGRDFHGGDTEGAAAVAVVSQAAARRFWPGRSPLGQRFRQDGRAVEVVGVARDSSSRRLGEENRPQLYRPFAQSYSPGMSLLVRSAQNPAALGTALRRAVRGLDADLPILTEMPLAEFIGRSLVPQRLAGAVTGSLGFVGLTLAAVGLYGLVAFNVSRRTREIAVRVALGAGRPRVTRLVLREGLRLALTGVAVGLAAAAAGSRLLAAMLPGVGPGDAFAYLGAAALMLCVSLAASWVPARRALRIEPAVALRAE